MSLVNLINYCYVLPSPNGDIVRAVDYAEQLQPEFRELHYDLVTNYPKKGGISYYRKHEYHALRSEQIKHGLFTPRPYSTANFPTSMAEYPHLTGLDVDPPKRSRRKEFSVRVLLLENYHWLLVAN